MEYIATFFTHSGAVKYKRYLGNLGVSVELFPVPRRLSSDCGIAAQFCTNLRLESLITGDVHRLFKVDLAGERLVYSADNR